MFVVLNGKRTGRPKSVVNDSAASRKSEVGIALSFWASIGTSMKDLWRVSNQVPPAGYAAFDGIAMTAI